MGKQGWCKFYSISNENHVEAIENGFWYSTPPQYFNDIADCNSELLDFKYIYMVYESFISGQHGIDRVAQRGIAVKENRRLINNCLGATCFTPYENILNHLMWAHYAENHKGVCLHFREIKPSNQLDYLEFQNDLPPMPYCIGQKFISVKYKRKYTTTTGLEKLFTVKKSCWKHEKEKRLIQVSPPFASLKVSQRKINFDKKSVLSIILGKQFKSNENYQNMLEVIKREYPDVMLYQIELKPKSFNLLLEQVEIEEKNKIFEIKKMKTNK